MALLCCVNVMWQPHARTRTHVVLLGIEILTECAADLSHGFHTNDSLDHQVRHVRGALTVCIVPIGSS